MKAAVLRQAGDLILEDRPAPSVGPGQVLVRVTHCGVCGSDVHYYQDGECGGNVVEAPVVLGHEFAGRVAAVGPQVRSVREGDAVAVEPGVACGRCGPCRRGRYNLCVDMRFAGTPPVDGAYVEYVVFPEAYVYKLPDDVDEVLGAMIEPVACAVHATERGAVGIGQRVAILGAGPIGLLTAIAAQERGGEVVLVSEPIPERRKMAEAIGARMVLDGRSKNLADVLDGDAPDVVFDCAGDQTTAQQAIELVGPGGKVVIVGFARGSSVPIDFGVAIRKEIDILPMYRFCHNHREAVVLLQRRREDITRLITHHFSLDELRQAFELVGAYREGVVKAMIDIGGA